MLRVELISADRGKLVLNEVDPGNLTDFSIDLKRSKENEGLFYEFTVNLDFNKASRAYIRDVYESEGIEGIIKVNIYQYLPNAKTWDIVHTGQLRLSNYDLGEIDVKTNIENIGFERRFINLLNQDVDIETLEAYNGESIPAPNIVQLSCPPKSIIKRSEVTPDSGDYFEQTGLIIHEFPTCATPGGCDRVRDETVWANVNTLGVVFNEIDEFYQLPWGFSQLAAINMMTVKDAGLIDLDISLNLKHTITATATYNNFTVKNQGNILGDVEIKAWFKHESVSGEVKTLTQIGSSWVIPEHSTVDVLVTDFEKKTYQQSGVTVEIGDKLYTYYTVRIFATYEQLFGALAATLEHYVGVNANVADTFIKVSQKTTFPATDSKSFYVYEILEKICQYLTGQADCFRSDYFGRTDTTPAYIEDGAGSLLALTNGRCLRQLSDNIIYVNWTDLFQTLNFLHCLGWGFETLEDGTNIIRVEKRSYFYQKAINVYDFGQISGLRKKPAIDRYYDQIEAGYPKIENINQINGIDEYNTFLRLSVPVTQAKGKLNLRAKYRASGFEIESQRRLIETTEDSRLDDENFIIGLRRNAGVLEVAQAQDYTTVVNVSDPNTSYNLDLTPRRALENWKELLASNVYRGNAKILKYTYGEGNRLLQATRSGETQALAENSDLDLTLADSLYIPDIYTFETELRAADYRVIRDNPKGVFSFTDWAGVKCSGFLLNISYTPEENRAMVDLMRTNHNVTIITETPAPWSPTDIGAALKGMYEVVGAGLVYDGDYRVSQLTDLSGAGNHFTSSGADRPLYEPANNRLKISGTEFFSNPGLLAAIGADQQGEVIAIAEQLNGLPPLVLRIFQAAGSDSFSLGMDSVGKPQILGKYFGSGDGRGKIVNIASDGVEHYSYINGVLQSDLNDTIDPTYWIGDFPSQDRLIMGYSEDLPLTMVSELYIKALIVVSGRMLTTDERNSMTSYLTEKYLT